MPPRTTFGPPLWISESLLNTPGLSEFAQCLNSTQLHRFGPNAAPAANTNSDASSQRLLETVGGIQRTAFEQTGNGLLNGAAYTRLFSNPIWYTYARGFQCMFSLQSLSDVRFFVGESGSVPPFLTDSVSDSNGYFGLNYSTTLGHTTWNVMSDSPSSGAPTRVDTGVPVSTDVLVYDHKTYDGTTFKVTLYDPESRTILYQGEKGTSPPRFFPNPPPDYGTIGALQVVGGSIAVIKTYYAIMYPITPIGYDL